MEDPTNLVEGQECNGVISGVISTLLKVAAFHKSASKALDDQILKQTQALRNNRAKNDDGEKGEKSPEERSEIFVEDEDNELLTEKLKNEVDMALAEIKVLKKGVPEGKNDSFYVLLFPRFIFYRLLFLAYQATSTIQPSPTF